MAHGVYLGPVARASDEGIVRGDRSIVAKPQHLSREIVRILRARSGRRVANADAHVQHAIPAKDNPRSERALSPGRKDVADVFEFAPVPAPMGQRDDPSAGLALCRFVGGRLVVGEVDQVVLAKRGWSARSIKPPMPPACTCGRPATGFGSSTPFRTMRKRPGRSVIRIPPSGRKAMLQG